MNRISLLIFIFLLSAFGGWMAPAWRDSVWFSTMAVSFLIIGGSVLIYELIRSYGLKQAAKIFATLSLFAYGVEMLGVKTGFPYGQFHYLHGLGPVILGVPWVLPLAWVPLMIGVWQLVSRSTVECWQRVAFTAWTLVALDLVLDPGAVSLGLWKYVSGGSYFSVPWSNMLGWVLSGSVGAWLASYLMIRPRGRSVVWSIPLISTLGFWVAVCARRGYLTPGLVGGILAVALVWLVHRDEKPLIC